MKFEEYLKEDLYKGVQAKAEKMAASSKDGTLKYDGETYHLKFDEKQWHYSITDSSNKHVINLNVKSLAKAKTELKNWLSS